MNGGTTTFQLEQRFRLPSLFDPPQMVASTNIQLNSGNDPEVTVRSEERCAGGRVGFGEVRSVSSDPQRLLHGRNGTVYSGALNEHGIFEDINRIGMGNGSTLLRNDGGSNPTTTVERTPHTSSGSEQTIHPVNGKKPLFSGLNASTHLDQSTSVIPSTSACDLGPKPLFSRLDFVDGTSRFSGSGSSHELFSKVANDLPSQISSFSDRPVPLMSFGNTASPNRPSHSIGRQIYDTPDKSTTSTYTVVQTNALNKLEPGENNGGIRAVSQHCFMQSGSQGPPSFIHPNKPSSPMPDFPSNVSLRTVSNSLDTDNILSPNVGPPFPTPPPMAPSGITSGPRPVNLVSPMTAPPPNLISGPGGLNCPPPDMSQPPPNIRNALGASNPESVQQMVNAVVGQSTVSGPTPVEVVTELIANAYNRTGNVRLHHDTSLKQRISMVTENTVMINKIRTPVPAGPPRPLSSVGKLPPPLMLSPGTRSGPASRISTFNKRKGSQIRPSTTRPQQRQKRQISDMIITPKFRILFGFSFIFPISRKQKEQISDHPSSHEEPDDNIFLIVSDEEDGNKYTVWKWQRLDSFEARRACSPEASKQAGNVVPGVDW
ncbi:unnamed protein product [Onchocerca flexuosa]|uniref:Trithorax group protein osa n=1 Tax=Onchocerca flexuosa TaxID=387005 RepID=A0A183I4R3_9BILA|nr:unnamed protein product [Onchocerca flexuosa]